MSSDDAVGRARALAERAHAGQPYGHEPYYVHLSEVAHVVEQFNLGDDYRVAAWLHDVVEDTPVTIEEIREQFGGLVADLVDAVTVGGLEREEHARLVVEQLSAHPAACALKLADRIANVEASQAGDRHAVRYLGEHTAFAAVVQNNVPPAMWRRYTDAIQAVEV